MHAINHSLSCRSCHDLTGDSLQLSKVMAYVPPHLRAAADAADRERIALTHSLAELSCGIESDTAPHAQHNSNQRGATNADVDQKHLRILCWEALREDNPKQLFKAIDQGVATSSRVTSTLATHADHATRWTNGCSPSHVAALKLALTGVVLPLGAQSTRRARAVARDAPQHECSCVTLYLAIAS